MNPITINNDKIGSGCPPYIIAELSANHNGSLEKAFQVLEMSAKAGANAVKLQTYTADTITLNCNKKEFQISGGLWDGRTLYELYEEAHTPWEWHKPLFDKAANLGITIFSTPFDHTAVDFLEDLGAPAYKIASFEVVDLPLIAYAAKTGKPMIISTGMADIAEISDAVECARDNGSGELIILHCVSSYPADASEFNLRTIKDMQKRFKCLVGLSDHTIDNTVSLTSIAFGACAIEKHVTLDRQGGGPDDSFSLEAKGLQSLCRKTRKAWNALGKVDYSRKECEKANIIFRRSLYITKDLKKGDILSSENVRSVRPGYGLPPKYYPTVIGKKLLNDVTENTALTMDLIDGKF